MSSPDFALKRGLAVESIPFVSILFDLNYLRMKTGMSESILFSKMLDEKDTILSVFVLCTSKFPSRLRLAGGALALNSCCDSSVYPSLFGHTLKG